MKKIASLFALGLMALVSIAPAQAATSADAKALLMLSPDTSSLSVGDTLSVQVLLDTKGISVSQVDFKLKYDPTALEVQDSDAQRSGMQIKDGDLFEVLLSTAPVDTRAGVIQYSKIALSENKYYTTAGQPGKLATIDFKALKAGSTQVTFDTTAVNGVEPTKVYRSSDEIQVLSQVTNGEYQVQAGNASPTATSSALPTATATASPTATATSTSTAAKSALSMTLDRTSLQANGKDKAQVRVSAKDQAGQPLANARVTLSITGSALIDPASITTNAQGIATASLTAGTQAGSIAVNARLESDPTVSATSQITSTPATTTVSPSATAQPTVTVKPTTQPTVRPTTPVKAPSELQQVGPGSLLASFLASLFIAFVVVYKKQLAKVVIKK